MIIRMHRAGSEGRGGRGGLVSRAEGGWREFFIGNLLVRIHLVIEMILVDRPRAIGVLNSLFQAALHLPSNEQSTSERPAPGDQPSDTLEGKSSGFRTCRPPKKTETTAKVDDAGTQKSRNLVQTAREYTGLGWALRFVFATLTFVTCHPFRGQQMRKPRSPSRATTRWSSTLSSKVNLPQVINFRA